MTENNPQKNSQNGFLALCTMLLHNKYEVFYGDDFPEKKQEMLGSNVLLPRLP